MVISAGILVHRPSSDGPEVLLAHPGAAENALALRDLISPASC
jgi:hypothetical protein